MSGILCAWEVEWTVGRMNGCMAGWMDEWNGRQRVNGSVGW